MHQQIFIIRWTYLFSLFYAMSMVLHDSVQELQGVIFIVPAMFLTHYLASFQANQT